jgi:hypothetical protein
MAAERKRSYGDGAQEGAVCEQIRPSERWRCRSSRLSRFGRTQSSEGGQRDQRRLGERWSRRAETFRQRASSKRAQNEGRRAETADPAIGEPAACRRRDRGGVCEGRRRRQRRGLREREGDERRPSEGRGIEGGRERGAQAGAGEGLANRVATVGGAPSAGVTAIRTITPAPITAPITSGGSPRDCSSGGRNGDSEPKLA